MRDVDRALARAYGSAPTSSARPGPAAPGPHFSIDAPDARLDPPEVPILAWPETVRALERSHGPRFETLADAILEAREDRGMKVLLFTSPHRAEGRTTLVLTLARALARRPGRTLLVDGDLGGPMLARSLGLRPTVGLDDVLERDTSLADALIEAPDDHLVILPVVASAGRPREAVTSPEWSRLMARLRREFDLVLIDGGPIFTGPSAATVAQSVDAAVLVHNKSRTTARALERAQDAIDAAGVPVLGLAETFC